MDSYRILISTLWYGNFLWWNSFKLGSNSQIEAFWRHSRLTLQTQGTFQSPFKNRWSAYACWWKSCQKIDHRFLFLIVMILLIKQATQREILWSFTNRRAWQKYLLIYKKDFFVRYKNYPVQWNLKVTGALYRGFVTSWVRYIEGFLVSKMFVTSRYSSLLLRNGVTLHYPDHCATKALTNYRG